jgi:hypothetical protein
MESSTVDPDYVHRIPAVEPDAQPPREEDEDLSEESSGDSVDGSDDAEDGDYIPTIEELDPEDYMPDLMEDDEDMTAIEADYLSTLRTKDNLAVAPESVPDLKQKAMEARWARAKARARANAKMMTFYDDWYKNGSARANIMLQAITNVNGKNAVKNHAIWVAQMFPRARAIISHGGPKSSVVQEVFPDGSTREFRDIITWDNTTMTRTIRTALEVAISTIFKEDEGAILWIGATNIRVAITVVQGFNPITHVICLSKLGSCRLADVMQFICRACCFLSYTAYDISVFKKGHLISPPNETVQEREAREARNGAFDTLQQRLDEVRAAIRDKHHELSAEADVDVDVDVEVDIAEMMKEVEAVEERMIFVDPDRVEREKRVKEFARLEAELTDVMGEVVDQEHDLAVLPAFEEFDGVAPEKRKKIEERIVELRAREEVIKATMKDIGPKSFDIKVLIDDTLFKNVKDMYKKDGTKQRIESCGPLTQRDVGVLGSGTVGHTKNRFVQKMAQNAAANEPLVAKATDAVAVPAAMKPPTAAQAARVREVASSVNQRAMEPTEEGKKRKERRSEERARKSADPSNGMFRHALLEFRPTFELHIFFVRRWHNRRKASQPSICRRKAIKARKDQRW